MDFQELKLNRFGYRAKQDVGTPTSEQLAINNRGVVPLPADNIKEGTDNSKNARNVITGTVITSCFIQTSALPNRVELAGNDARFYDDSTGGTGSINGDTASIQFIRSDKNPGDFIIQKRHGVTNDLQNVFEMYYSEAAGGGQSNYFFIGRSGVATEAKTFTDFVVLHGKDSVRAEITRVFHYESRPTIYSVDYSHVDGTKQGAYTTIAGEGKDGFSGLGKLVEVLTFSSATAFAVGDTITGNATGAKALIIFKASTTIFYANHTNSIDFNPATDNACTTNGGGGGTGTGDLSANSFATALILYTDPNLNALLGGNLYPDTDNAYDIGSASLRVKNIYVAGSIIGGGTTWKNGVSSWGGAAASGSLVITHGLGHTPNYVKITCMQNWGSDFTSESTGTYNGTTYATVYSARNPSGGIPSTGTATNRIAYIFNSGAGTPLQDATITLSSTTITLNWVKTGSGGANTIAILWEAQ